MSGPSDTYSAEGLASTKTSRVTGLSSTALASTAMSNSLKEELCLEYVENFRKQFVDLFPKRRPLLLTGQNEAAVQKFVCTTLRPTQLPFRDIYDHQQCADFVADFFLYEPLPDPQVPPEHLPSPSQILSWRVGDCFDLSNVLASYLIGNGYDAYCVYGTAPQWITLRDTSYEPCPFKEPAFDMDATGAEGSADDESKLGEAEAKAKAGAGSGDAAGDAGPSPIKSKYKLEPKPALESEYLKTMAARAAAEAEAAAKKASGETIEESDDDDGVDDVPPPRPHDPLNGRRVHCWVLIRAGKRNVERHVFVEPSTGRVYSVDDSPYQTIESVWNNRNYWVNMQSDLVLPAPLPSGAAAAGEEDDGGAGAGAGAGSGADASSGADAGGAGSGAGASASADAGGDGADGGGAGAAGDASESKDADLSQPPSTLARRHAARKAAAAAAAAAGGRGDTDAPAGVLPLDSVRDMSFDLDNPDNWEYVFIETASLVPTTGTNPDGADGLDTGGLDLDTGMPTVDPTAGAADATDTKDGGDGDGEGDGTGVGDGEHVLDLPPSWVPKLVVDRDSYLLRYPKGSRVTVYRKAKLEVYAPHVHTEGLVARCTWYSDYARSEVERLVEVYAARADKLVKRVRLPLEQTTKEYFEPGRPSGLKLHVEVLARRREMRFYVAARIDGLEKRVEVIGKKIMEWYKESEDSKLLYRSATLMPADDAAELAARQARAAAAGPAAAAAASNKGVTFPTLPTAAGELPLLKMTEKFARNPDVGAEKDAARRTYLLEDQVIQVQHHHAPGRITASSRLYTKHNTGVELTTVDPFAPPVTQAQLDADFRAVIQAEKDCISALKASQRHIGVLLKHRARQEERVTLEKTVFETALERAKSGPRDTHVVSAVEDASERKFDFLAPFLQFVEDPNNITKAEAQRADRECRKALKARLIERVNIIQRRLNEENEMLQKKQQEFQRNRDQVDGAEESFEQFCAEAMFRIGILEQRMQRQEETVMAKYAELEKQLKADPRLAALHQGP